MRTVPSARVADSSKLNGKGNSAEGNEKAKSFLIVYRTGMQLSSYFDGELSHIKSCLICQHFYYTV